MKKNIVKRTETSVRQIKLAFWGASKNLYLLEDALAKIGSISIHQYSNYLSQLAFAIELGLKSIIVNTDDFEEIHDLSTLFLNTHPLFQKKLTELCHKAESFDTAMESTKKMYVDFKYMQLNGNLKEFLDESIEDTDKTIDFEKALNLPKVAFLQILLEEIINFEKFIWEEFRKQNPIIDCSDPDSVINLYTEFLKNTSSNIDLVKKENNG